jgi:hypothetical protein
MVGGMRAVAVKANVGSGVSVGGSGVKVGMRVGDSSGGRVKGTGWNGVGVGNAFGLTVTSTSVGGTGAEGAIPQEEMINPQRMIKT